MYDLKTYRFTWKDEQAQQYSDGTNNMSRDYCNANEENAIDRS
jgi:hypothetical protein